MCFGPIPRIQKLSCLPTWPQYCRATPTDSLPFFGNPVSSTTHATTGPWRSIAGSTKSRALSNTAFVSRPESGRRAAEPLLHGCADHDAFTAFRADERLHGREARKNVECAAMFTSGARDGLRLRQVQHGVLHVTHWDGPDHGAIIRCKRCRPFPRATGPSGSHSNQLRRCPRAG
jgi:hypothetical protein